VARPVLSDRPAVSESVDDDAEIRTEEVAELMLVDGVELLVVRCRDALSHMLARTSNAKLVRRRL
jgi:hypothetical protein